ncbi:MAG TPA: DoxX family protein [Kofleriaceae bacterium]
MEATLSQVGSAPRAASTATITSRARWAGRILSGIPTLALAFDAGGKFANIEPVREAFVHLGLPTSTASVIAIIELVCLALYLVPRTAVLGAVLLTGFLGGAVAIHLRIGDPLATHTLFPIYMGIIVWLGLYLRDVRVRALGKTLLGGPQ